MLWDSHVNHIAAGFKTIGRTRSIEATPGRQGASSFFVQQADQAHSSAAPPLRCDAYSEQAFIGKLHSPPSSPPAANPHGCQARRKLETRNETRNRQGIAGMSPISAQDLQSEPTKPKSIVLRQMQLPFLTRHWTLATCAAPEPLSLRHQNYSCLAVLPRGQPTTNAEPESEGRLIWERSAYMGVF